MASHVLLSVTEDSSDAFRSRDPLNASRIPPKASRRRDKPQLSCNQCRRRKSRCDRQRPCSSCSTRGQMCTYSESSGTTSHLEPSRTTGSVHDRIVQLERMVMSLIPSPATNLVTNAASRINMPITPSTSIVSTTRPIQPADDTCSESGSMRISDHEHHYVGGDHWVAILESIADLKDCLDREEQQTLSERDKTLEDSQENGNATPASRFGASLLYGCPRATSREEILTALPPKPAVDRYISRYFNYLDLVSSASVHGPSFLREYDAFWNEPSSAPIIWVGLLFSMICLACLTSDTSEGPDAKQQSLQVDLYREKIVQCLVMAEYTKAGPYVLETVINYVYVEFIIHPDADKDMWLLLALEVNLARRMGYHRDPSHFPNIFPFQAEMRRRLWATVLMSDILLSSQMGMPRMIADSQYDTAEPRNLTDNDFDKDTIDLPSSRPESEVTPALGILARTRMLKALGLIADLTSAVEPCAYSEIMRVDKILHEAAESIPHPLQMKPMSASLTDSPQIIVARLFIRHMFYKGKVMLHRKFVHRQTDQKRHTYDYSHGTCLDACLRSLEIQKVLDEETCPGGQLHTMRWRVTSIMNHQFLTATMLLCSLLYHGSMKDVEQVAEIRSALQSTRTFWIRRSSTSKEAEKAAEAVSLVLARTSQNNENANHHLFEGFLPHELLDREPGISTSDEWSAFVNWPGFHS
ncbi:fungal-specific transcription factor domain-containing protein [Aspergillus karnatakaensis]|uniref:putative transcription factor n=1 Tax=Aspergillus karnatakaensis TaxID=1810916 RepID=UPI003CCE017B